MSKTAHTPGKVHVIKTIAAYQIRDSFAERLCSIATNRVRQQSDAHRLRDCWNACEGIADPSVVPEAIALLREAAELRLPADLWTRIAGALDKLEGRS